MGENRHAISLRDGTVSVDGRILLELLMQSQYGEIRDYTE